MKQIQFGKAGKEGPGVQLEDGSCIDVSAFSSDYNEEFLGSDGISTLRDWLNTNQNLPYSWGYSVGTSYSPAFKIVVCWTQLYKTCGARWYGLAQGTGYFF